MIKEAGTFDFKGQTGNNVYNNLLTALKADAMLAVGMEYAFDGQLKDRMIALGNPPINTYRLIRDHGMRVEEGYLAEDGTISWSKFERRDMDPALERIMEAFKNSELHPGDEFDLEENGNINVTNRQ